MSRRITVELNKRELDLLVHALDVYAQVLEPDLGMGSRAERAEMQAIYNATKELLDFVSVKAMLGTPQPQSGADVLLSHLNWAIKKVEGE